METRINHDLLRCRLNVSLQLNSGVLRALKVVLVVVEVTLDVSDHREFLVQSEQGGLHPVDLDITLSKLELQLLILILKLGERVVLHIVLSERLLWRGHGISERFFWG